MSDDPEHPADSLREAADYVADARDRLEVSDETRAKLYSSIFNDLTGTIGELASLTETHHEEDDDE